MKLNKLKFVWMLAKRDLVEDKKITIIVIAMLSFSFLNLAFFPAFIDGLTDTFNEGVIETEIGHVSVTAEDEYINNADAVAEKISRLNGVKEVEKRIEKTVYLKYKNEESSAKFVGTSTPDSAVYRGPLESGNLITKEDNKEMVLGGALAEREDGLDIGRGRKLTVTSDKYNYTQKYKVKGIIGRAGAGSLRSTAIVTYDDAEEIIGKEDVATSVKILLKEDNDIESFKLRLQELNVGEDLETWNEQSDMASNVSQTFGIVTMTVSVVGVIIALTSVGVVIFINTNKRAREMGIIRAIGSESTQVIWIFVLESFLLGLSGVIFGNIVLLGLDAYLVSNPISSPMGPMTTAVTQNLLWTRSLVMLVSSLAAGFIPAYLVSKDNIVETIDAQ